MTIIAAADPTAAHVDQTRIVVPEATANRHEARALALREVPFVDHAVRPPAKVSE